MATRLDHENNASLNSMARSLRIIASLMEGAEMRRRQMMADIDPDALGTLALWREEVAAGKTMLGFSDWVAWHSQKETP